MLIARWQIDARFGHKPAVIDRIQAWGRDIAPQVGLHRAQLLTGSIGAPEATVEDNWQVETLAELEQAWARLGTLEAHRQWGKALEPYVVSGTARWTVWRVLPSHAVG